MSKARCNPEIWTLANNIIKVDSGHQLTFPFLQDLSPWQIPCFFLKADYWLYMGKLLEVIYEMFHLLNCGFEIK